MLSIALPKAVPQQSRATPFVPVQSFNTNERQIPMRLGWAVIFRPLKGSAHVGLLLSGDAFCNDSLKRLIIGVNTRWKPERDAEAVAGAVRSSCFKRVCSKSSE